MSSGGGLPGPPPISFEELLRSNTGWSMAHETWQQRQARQDALEAEDARLMDALEAEGIPVRAGRLDVVAVGLVTGQVEAIESYRAIRFLPSIAQRERQPMLNGLRSCVRHERWGRYLRLVVVTAGGRVPLGGDLRGRMQGLHRRISRFAHLAARRFGIDVIYRGTEFTVDDACTFHVHANILLSPREALPRERWSDFLAWMHRFFGTHVHDAGRLRKPEEAIKYPFKPLDLARLNGPAAAWVYDQTKKLKIAQPFGSSRESLGRLEHERLKIAFNHRRQRLEPVEKARRGPHQPGAPGVDTGQENQVLCLTAPQARFSRFAEPVALIRGYNPEPATSAGLSAPGFPGAEKPRAGVVDGEWRVRSRGRPAETAGHPAGTQRRLRSAIPPATRGSSTAIRAGIPGDPPVPAGAPRERDHRIGEAGDARTVGRTRHPFNVHTSSRPLKN